jgi:hypothetical protein
MGRQIQLYVCPSMRTAIETEAQRIGAKLVRCSAEGADIQFSAGDAKRGSVYDRKAKLWVKRASLEAFRSYRIARQKSLDELVARNRKFYIEVLGGRPVKNMKANHQSAASNSDESRAGRRPADE